MLGKLLLNNGFYNLKFFRFFCRQDIMAKYGEEVIVHVLGFSDQHNGVFLKDLSLLVRTLSVNDVTNF